jgi:hypothetical protein
MDVNTKEPPTYEKLRTTEKLNIGIMNALKKTFNLGVKYTKDVMIDITTAEAQILVDMSMSTVDKFMTKVEDNPKLKVMMNTYFPKIVDMLDSNISILRYIGYDYLTKSYNQYINSHKSYLDDTGKELSKDGLGFKRLLDLTTTLDGQQPIHQQPQPQETPPQQHQQQPLHKPQSQQQHQGGGGSVNVLILLDRLTDDVLKLPLQIQQDELIKISDIIKKRVTSQSQVGGRGRRKKNKNKTRRIKKIIRRTIRSFTI